MPDILLWILIVDGIAGFACLIGLLIPVTILVWQDVLRRHK